MNNREFWLLLILPSVCQVLLPHLWIDFFLLGLFYVAFNKKVFPFFLMVFLWSIIYSITTTDNPGGEMLALGTVWYMFSSFKIDTDIKRIVSAVIGCFLYLIVKFCLISGGCIWNIPMTIVFSVWFILIHTTICFIFIIVRYHLSKGYLSTT
ncbi:MAG: hypothetical protein ACPL3Q_01060 [Candidatus Ratteibacteria bacterium]